jgi:hypothetical protein
MNQPELPLDLPPSTRKQRAIPVTRSMKAAAQEPPAGTTGRMVLALRHLAHGRIAFTPALLAERSGRALAEAERLLKWAYRQGWVEQANRSAGVPRAGRGSDFYVGRL